MRCSGRALRAMASSALLPQLCGAAPGPEGGHGQCRALGRDSGSQAPGWAGFSSQWFGGPYLPAEGWLRAHTAGSPSPQLQLCLCRAMSTAGAREKVCVQLFSPALRAPLLGCSFCAPRQLSVLWQAFSLSDQQITCFNAFTLPPSLTSQRTAPFHCKAE